MNMEAAPCLLIRNSKNISSKHALKTLTKFIDKHGRQDSSNLSLSISQRAGLVPDDVIAKLSIIKSNIIHLQNNDGNYESKNILDLNVTANQVQKLNKKDRKRRNSLASSKRSKKDEISPV